MHIRHDTRNWWLRAKSLPILQLNCLHQSSTPRSSSSLISANRMLRQQLLTKTGGHKYWDRRTFRSTSMSTGNDCMCYYIVDIWRNKSCPCYLSIREEVARCNHRWREE